ALQIASRRGFGVLPRRAAAGAAELSARARRAAHAMARAHRGGAAAGGHDDGVTRPARAALSLSVRSGGARRVGAVHARRPCLGAHNAAPTPASPSAATV